MRPWAETASYEHELIELLTRKASRQYPWTSIEGVEVWQSITYPRKANGFQQEIYR